MNSPLKWHGGKHYLASRIVAMMPKHIHYVEPFAGGLSVLLAKDPEGVSEVVNDLHGELSNFWRVLADSVNFSLFQRVLAATPFSEDVYDRASDFDPDAPVGCSSLMVRAYAFFIHCRMSLAGRMDSFAALSRTRIRRGMNEQASAWLSAVDGLPAVHNRLRRVVILNRPAIDAIRTQDGPDTLFYCDPPYLQETRTAKDVYAHEMTESDHVELLTLLNQVKGKVMLSGYRSDIYDAWLGSWHRVDFKLPNNAAGGTSKRQMTECVWCNFEPVGTP